jgi:enhancing lycopene biosynthesis protein 2
VPWFVAPIISGLFSLASVLNRKGYDSKFIYGGYGYFDNMNAFFAGNGYQVVDRTDFAAKMSKVLAMCGASLMSICICARCVRLIKVMPPKSRFSRWY